MKKALLFFLLALLATHDLWAQSKKAPAQIQPLFERYKQNQALSKEEYNLLNPYLGELMQADLSVQTEQNRTIGGGTAQTNLVSTAYNFSQTTGTYTPITGGTVLGTGTAVDDNNYSGQSIGFTFTYDGAPYTTLGVNSNGFIWFGTTAPATNTYTPISTTGASGSRIVSALGGDLQGLTTGELRIETIGTAPNRECVVQWSNFRHYFATGDNYNFQIRLREQDGRIEIHYGAFTKNTTNRAYQVGLRGTANTDFNNRTTTTNWSASTAGTVNNATMSLTTTVLPTSGLIFQFNPPPPANDVGVTGVVSPANSAIIPVGVPTDISATVFNFGTDPQTVNEVYYNVNNGTPVGPVSAGTLASGGSATVTFTGANAFTPPSPGIYTIKVFTAHPGDGDAANDTTTISVGVVPIISVTNTTPYFENFEASAGGWFSQAVSGTVNDWVRGTPAKANINSAYSGTQAWVTRLTAGYQNNQNSAVVSPIFDLSSLTVDPIVSFRGFMHITDLDYDAGVFEYSTNNGTSWTKLGVLQANETDPQALNWYNSSSASGPIAPPKWSKTDAGYLLVRKTLEGLAGQSSVIIRLRFGSDAILGGQGWAFDDFAITPVTGPQIGVSGNGNPIANGSTTPSLTNHTDFGFANTTAARPSPNVYPVPVFERSQQTEKHTAATGEASEVKGESVARMSVKPTETPIANVLPGTVVRTFTITNTGVDPLNISSVTITGADAAEFSVTTPPASTVNPSGSTTFQITFNPSTDGVKNATVNIANDDANNNPFTFAIRGTGATSLPLPYFASLNGTAPDWTVQVVNAVGTNPIFGLTTSGVTLPDGSSGGAVRANFFDADAGRVEILRTPLISLSGATNPVLNFDVSYRSYSGENDRIEVVVSTDGGATWLTGSPVLYDKSRTSTPSLATLTDNTANFTPSAASQWRHETVDLSQFAGQTDLLIGFRATSAYGNNAWIANVTIQDVPSLAVSNVTSNATFSQLGLTITFTNFGGSGGNLYFSRFNSTPSSDAPIEYADNTTATTQDGSIFTPNVAAPRWWTITYDGQTLGATINYDVSIDITGIPGVNNPDRLYILRRSNRFGSWVALPTTHSGNILTATGLTGFSDFGIGGNSGDNPLPVNLGTFTGRNIPQGVELRWTTISETDNAGFEVRRAELVNGVEQEWLTVATYRNEQSLVGQGTTSEAHSYTYTDRGVQVGKTYRYALRSVDFNGTIHDYPQTVSVEVTQLTPRVYTYKLEQNYPNPFNPSTRIIYQVAATSNVKLEVFDMLGRKVATLVNERKNAGEYSVNFNAQNLSSGVYFYRLQTDKFTQTKKMMLVK